MCIGVRNIWFAVLFKGSIYIILVVMSRCIVSFRVLLLLQCVWNFASNDSSLYLYCCGDFMHLYYVGLHQNILCFMKNVSKWSLVHFYLSALHMKNIELFGSSYYSSSRVMANPKSEMPSDWGFQSCCRHFLLCIYVVIAF